MILRKDLVQLIMEGYALEAKWLHLHVSFWIGVFFGLKAHCSTGNIDILYIYTTGSIRFLFEKVHTSTLVL